MQFKTQFDKPNKVFQTTNKPSKTKQSFKNQCDINAIIQKAQKNGELPDLIKKTPHYGDFSNAPDYRSALDLIIHAEAQFEALPSYVRDRFANDPANFLEFATNPENLSEMKGLGLTKPEIIDPKPIEPMHPPKDAK